MIYFYLCSVSGVSLVLFFVSTLFLASGSSSLAFGHGDAMKAGRYIATGIGIAIPALVAWGIHWRWLLREIPKARETSWFRFYLFTVLCLNVMAMLVTGGVSLSGFARVLLDVAKAPAADLARSSTSTWALFLSAGIWYLHWRELQALKNLPVPLPPPAPPLPGPPEV
jgi:hypothetical protein